LERSALFTPYFSIYTNTTYKISFYTRFKTEAFQDGGTVEYSTDNGTTWTVLGNSTNPQWMNSSSITALNNLPQIVPGWSGANATWVNMEHLICIPSPAGTIAASLLFRFNFASDFSIQDEGWQIDDFCFKQDTAVCVVGISEVENNSMLELKQNIPNPFSRNTYIDYILPGKGKVKLSITDIAGREVYIPVDAVQEKGIYRIIVDASILKAGIYYYFLKFEEKTIVKKMLVE
jgi:hypothetical protein